MARTNLKKVNNWSPAIHSQIGSGHTSIYCDHGTSNFDRQSFIYLYLNYTNHGNQPIYIPTGTTYIVYIHLLLYMAYTARRQTCTQYGQSNLNNKKQNVFTEHLQSSNLLVRFIGVYFLLIKFISAFHGYNFYINTL